MKATFIILIAAFIVSGQSTPATRPEVKSEPTLDTLSLRLDSDQIEINRAKVDYSRSWQEVNTTLDSIKIAK